jgi:hypothetical protein
MVFLINKTCQLTGGRSSYSSIQSNVNAGHVTNRANFQSQVGSNVAKLSIRESSANSQLQKKTKKTNKLTGSVNKRFYLEMLIG